MRIMKLRSTIYLRAAAASKRNGNHQSSIAVIIRKIGWESAVNVGDEMQRRSVEHRRSGISAVAVAVAVADFQ